MHYRSYVSGVLTSCSRSWEAIALSTFFLDVSWISPPISNSSSMKYAFSKLNIISNSQTCKQSKLLSSSLHTASCNIFHLHCQNTYPRARHSGVWSPVSVARYHFARWRNRNINWHNCKQSNGTLTIQIKS